MQRQRSGGSHPSTAHVPSSVVSFAAQPAAYTTALKGGPATAAEDENQNEPSTHKSLAHALLPDLPLLMHGSGDVLPEHVHPHSVAVLAQLIEKYVASLVSAAMDAHDVFTDGEVVGGGACLGVPPYNYKPAGEDDDDETANKRKSSGQSEATPRRKKRKKVDYWDVPLPPPTDPADEGDATSLCGDSEISDESSDDDVPLGLRRLSSSASSSSVLSAAEMSALGGFAPVDLHAHRRTRDYYVSAPTVMDARSFIFPICHDAALYQRVKEVQASRRSIGRDLVDGVMMEVMKEEGANIGRWGAVDMMDAVLGGRAGGVEGDGDAAGNAASGDKKKGGDKGGEKDKAKGAEKKKEPSPEEKKNDNNDGTNLVGAGLLDPDDVDPSWPGLNALLRGKLW